MKKKPYIYISLIAALLISISGCKNNTSSNNTQAPAGSSAPAVESSASADSTPSADATAAPVEAGTLETEAPVSDAKYDGKTYKSDKGLQLEYDASVFEAKEENGASRILPNGEDKDAQDNLNLFINVLPMTDITAQDMQKELEKANSKMTDTSTVNIGKDNEEATKITVKEETADTENTLRHEYYLVQKGETLWLVELKCPQKYEKKYGEKIDKVLSTLSFE